MRARTIKPRFTEAEAIALLGRRVRSLGAYAYLPAGTAGQVVAREEVEPGCYDVVVAWDGSPRAPLHDWFSRDEFERYLVEA